MSGVREAMRDVKRAMGELSKQVPEEMDGFNQFMEAVLKPGKLDLKTKELLAVGMGLTARCKYCIGSTRRRRWPPVPPPRSCGRWRRSR